MEASNPGENFVRVFLAVFFKCSVLSTYSLPVWFSPRIDLQHPAVVLDPELLVPDTDSDSDFQKVSYPTQVYA